MKEIKKIIPGVWYVDGKPYPGLTYSQANEKLEKEVSVPENNTKTTTSISQNKKP